MNCEQCPNPLNGRKRFCSRSCMGRASAARFNSDPAIAAKRKAGIQRSFADPNRMERHKRLSAENMARGRSTPEFQSWLREHGRRQARDVLSRPDVVAKVLSPEVRAKAGRKRTATTLAWCPLGLRPLYKQLVGVQHYSAAEARQMIEDTIERDSRRAARAYSESQRRARA